MKHMPTVLAGELAFSGLYNAILHSLKVVFKVDPKGQTKILHLYLDLCAATGLEAVLHRRSP